MQKAEWSKWVESVRKDVECTFGILKGRFRCLKLPILYHDKKRIDDTCWLAKMDHSGEDIAIFRNHNRRVLARTDYSYIGVDVDCMPVHMQGEKESEPSHSVLTRKVIYHYTQMRKKGLIQWLK